MNPLELLSYACPVALAALGETANQKSGVLNVGIEGTMLSGAYAALVATTSTGQPLVGLAAGLATGVVVSVFQSFFTLKLRADQIVVGTAINLLAVGVTSTLFRRAYGTSPDLISLPNMPRVGGVDFVMVATLLLMIGFWFGFKRTNLGLILRACGERPQAIEVMGFPVLKIRFAASLVGGALAGLGGAYLTTGVAQSFIENGTAGRGFVALAMVTFGRWQPIRVVGACLLVGLLEILQFKAQALGLNVPPQLLLSIPYLGTLLVLVAFGKGIPAPFSLGQAYKKVGE